MIDPRLGAVLLALSTTLALTAGCDDEDTGGPRKELTITLVGKSTQNPVFVSAIAGAEAAAKKAAQRSTKIRVTIVSRTPKGEDPGAQAKAIREAAQAAAKAPKGTHAILVSCSNAKVVGPAIDEAVQLGVPVMTFDSDAADSKRFAFLGANDGKIGEQVLDELATLIGKSGKIAVLAGNRDADNLRARVAGVQKAAKQRYPRIEIVGVFNHVETPKAAAAAMAMAERKHQDLVGWAMVGGWPLFSSDLLDTLDPAKRKIVAVDALPAQLPYIEKGKVPVLLGLPTYRWGYTSVEILVAKLQGDAKKTSAKALDKLREQIVPIKVFRDNLGGWSRQLRAWGYRDVPRRYLTR
jgi:ribose transport system substrate-binding protein